MQRKVKQLKTAKRTKMNKLPKMRYFKIPLCPKFKYCEKTKMPLGQKRLELTQTDSDAKLRRFFVQNLINGLCRQTEKTQGQTAGTENGFLRGK